jgi:hypothetical protein
MSTTARLAADPWVRGCGAVGVLMLAVAAIVDLPWLLWLGWAYVSGLSVWEAARRRAPREASRDTDHTGERRRVWQTRSDE